MRRGVARVDFLVDDVLLFGDSVSPFEATFDTTTVADGDHVITARAEDTAGNVATSAGLNVVVDNAPPPDTQPPSITLLDPGGEARGVVTLEASATDNVGVALVRFFVDGQLVVTDMAAPFAADWDSSSVADGLHTLSAQAQDAAGNTGDSATLNITVNNAPPPDTTAPVVTVSVPASPLSGTVVLAVDATDEVGVVAVRLYVDDELLGTATQAPYQFDLDTSLRVDGDYVVRAEAEDAAGNVGLSSSVTVTIDNTGPGDLIAPTVSLENLPTTLTGSVTVVATASDDVGVVDVTLLVDGVALGSDITAPYEYALDTTLLVDGSHTLQASARDAAGNVGQSAVLTVVVDNADRLAPVVTLTRPASPVSGQITLTATATDNEAVVSIELFADGVSLGQDTDAPYEFVWDTTGLTDANHVLSAQALDAAGNVGAAPPQVIDVANGGPQPTLSWIQQEIFDVSCAAGCHIDGGIAPFMRLDAANAFADMVNVPASQGGSSLRVTPGDADDSALVQRLEGTLTPAMPLGGSLLPAEQIEAVRAWIDGGAFATPPDVIAPAVSLAPLAATVSDTITLDAFAVDDVAVIEVRFVVNGTEVGSVAMTPYSLLWDTGDVADGTYPVRARALDAAGNITDSPALTIVVDNATN